MTTFVIAAVATVALSAFVAVTRDHTVTVYGAWERATRRSDVDVGQER